MLAEVSVSRPMAGTWTLRRPDGMVFESDSPLGCVDQEQSDRIPLSVALARIDAALSDPVEDLLEEVRAALADLKSSDAKSTGPLAEPSANVSSRRNSTHRWLAPGRRR